MKLLSLEEIDKRLDKILPELSKDYDVDSYMKTFGLNRKSAINLCRTIQYECDHEILTAMFKIADPAMKNNEYMKKHEEYLELSRMIAKHNKNL
jgi:hypothetical protein